MAEKQKDMTGKQKETARKLRGTGEEKFPCPRNQKPLPAS